MSRPLVFVAVALLSAVGGYVLCLASPAEAAGTKVVCQQVVQRPGGVDEQFVANFMSEQLALGHERFTTVQGMSTVICAY
jgi:hypothetical protein